MRGSNTFEFQIVRRKNRAEPLVARIRAYSKQFKKHLSRGDTVGMQKTSKIAWDTMVILFETLRNEADHGNLASSFMRQPTGIMANNVSAAERAAMITANRINRSHSSCRPATLLDALNKIAHYDTVTASFRVDGRGAHYLVLGGRRDNRDWVIEILVEKLCRNASRAIKAIQ